MAFQRHTAKDVTGYNKTIHDLKWNREGLKISFFFLVSCGSSFNYAYYPLCTVGNYLGIISGDKTVKVGQLDRSGTFQNVHNIPNSAQMMQLCWNPANDSRLGVCGDDKAVELWDVRGK